MNNDEQIPLVVDLDGTLVRTDMLLESLVSALVNNSIGVIKNIHLVTRSKSSMKEYLAEEFEFEVSQLPFREEVVKQIKNSQSAGREVVLATAAAHKVAHRIYSESGLFGSVISSSATVNLSGLQKSKALVDLYGHKGFDYIGDSLKDLPVWESARIPYFVGTNKAARLAFRKLGSGVIVEDGNRMAMLGSWIKALRIRQWVKNLLVFLPAIAAQRVFEADILPQLLVAFLAFGFLASAVYLVNDIVDLNNDRSHKTKRKRPIAAGEILISSALVASVFLIFASGVLSLLMLPWSLSLALLVYLIVTTAYTTLLKKYLIIDVVTLAGLYSLRIVAGGLAVGIPVSSWLLAFSFFMFLSLAFVKRSSELFQLPTSGNNAVAGRAYLPQDISTVSTLGIASGFLSVLVFALYLDSDVANELYQSSQVLWGVVPVLVFWISWVWIKSGRGQVNEDPILFALTDKVSLLTGTLLVALFAFAQLGLF